MSDETVKTLERLRRKALAENFALRVLLADRDPRSRASGPARIFLFAGPEARMHAFRARTPFAAKLAWLALTFPDYLESLRPNWDAPYRLATSMDPVSANDEALLDQAMSNKGYRIIDLGEEPLASEGGRS